MDEKTMVNDVLDSCKTSLNGTAIINTIDMTLRQTIQKIRNNEESFQYEMLKIAQLKEYKTLEFQASESEIEQVKNELQ